MNHTGTLSLKIVTIDKGEVNEQSLIDIFDIDMDFKENVDAFRSTTLKKGFKSESERVSFRDIPKEQQKISAEDDEFGLVGAMLEDVFKVENFIGNSSYYGSFEYDITETDFQYVISIAYTS